MRLGTALRGLTFGELAKIRGIVYHHLSPFEQRAFAGILKKGVPNTIRRFAENFWMVTPPFVGSYIIYVYYENLAEKMMRKNPDDYACDE